MVRKYGATHVFDYNDVNAVDKIKKLTHGKLKYAIDAVSSKTADSCVAALASDGSIVTFAGKATNVPTTIHQQ